MGYDSSDYRRDYRQVEADTKWTAWRILLILIVATVVLGTVGFVIRLASTPAALVEKATDPDHIISNYEEFQNMWNATQKLDSDLKTICDTPDADPMFAQFSKGAMVAAKRQQMTRWVNEYNAKSKMWNRQYWKSKSLPYQLSEEDFPNYNCNSKGSVK